METDRPLSRFSSFSLVAVPLVAGLLAVGCSGGSSSSTDAVSGSASDGAAIYASSCASCHGSDLGGTARGPSHLSIVYEPSHHSDAAFASAIENGAQQHHWNFGAMPPVGGLSDDDVAAVIAFVRSEQERLGFDEG